MNIRELLARRTDLSTFLVHLTRSEGESAARGRLCEILRTRTIQGRTVYGQAKGVSLAPGPDADSQKVVCFTETPLEFIHLLSESLEGRQYHFEPYGVALTKKVARERGANPVWYLDITPNHDWLTVPCNDLIDEAIAAGNFADSHIAKLACFIEQMGTQQNGARKEFWWEREWRHRGDFSLPDPIIVLCPEEDFGYFRRIFREDPAGRASFIDPAWSLEQIIARSTGFSKAQVDLV